jgi:hypothetical protein
LEDDIVSGVNRELAEHTTDWTCKPQATGSVKKEQSSLTNVVTFASVLPQTAPFTNANRLPGTRSANRVFHLKSYAHSFCQSRCTFRTLDSDHLAGEDESCSSRYLRHIQPRRVLSLAIRQEMHIAQQKKRERRYRAIHS